MSTRTIPVVLRLVRALGLLVLLPLGTLRCGDGREGDSAKAVRSAHASYASNVSYASYASYASNGALAKPLAAPPKHLNVLLICIDTLRADSLDPWPNSRQLMPGLTAWCKRAVVFRQATSAATWTGPSVASLLTGLLPSHHGAREFSDPFRLVDAVPTLAEILSRQSWRTAVFSGGAWVSKDTGVLQGFERAKDPFSFGGGADLFLGFNETLRAIAPWFLFLHTYEAHDPYGAPPPSPGQPRPTPRAVDAAALEAASATDGGRELTRLFLTDAAVRQPLFESAGSERRTKKVKQYLERGFAADPERVRVAAGAREAYENGVRTLDTALSNYLRRAEAAHVFDDTIIVVTADHGESFGEHDTLHHGRRLYDELLRVPLAIRAPGWPEGLVVEEPVSLLDVVPTVLELLGLPVPSDGDGQSLVPLVGGGAGRPCVSEEVRSESETGYPGDDELTAVRSARWKWIETRDRATGAAREERFDLEADPAEKAPISGADPAGWPAAFRAAVERVRAARAPR